VRERVFAKNPTHSEAQLTQFVSPLDDLLRAFAPLFTRPTFLTFSTLAKGAVLAHGRRTVTGIIRAAGEMAGKSYPTYHRFLSAVNWDEWRAFRILMGLVLSVVSGPVVLLVDETTVRRWGPKVWAKGCHRDAVRSSHKNIVYCFGHKWVTLSVAVKFPFAKRCWALPVGSLLYQSKKLCEGRYRTSYDLIKILLYKTVRCFPDREFILVGDGGFSSCEFTSWCSALGCELISRLRVDSALYDKPPARKPGQRGRPRKRGQRQMSFQDRFAGKSDETWNEGEVAWYEGKTKPLKWMTGTALRYAPNISLPLVRWVLVSEPSSDKWECFYSTNPNRSARSIIEHYVLRWSIEVTFQEAREQLGLETAKNWCRNSVSRTVPAIFSLFTIVSLCYQRICEQETPRLRRDPWYPKTEPTFSDALVAVRKTLWARIISHAPRDQRQHVKIDRQHWEFISERLSATG